ncbi:MAG: Trigger factor [Candidatus Aminicenantes bacterium ADurb.Bin508]|nr:MAG: Trigger factor [Candidatus Aminicenantes bacterium ADurb.Bin508]HNX41375.1 trigger factor [Candidatus Aminicenantes bacterium]HPB54767.1 trigger factor [Candidatus Aminicenantes bacterium]HPS99535.1 trigger factor [Candidatus Aminicenantes bacterium]
MTDEKNIKEEEIQQEPVSAEAGGEDLHKTPLEGETPASEEDFQVNEKDKELTKKVEVKVEDEKILQEMEKKLQKYAGRVKLKGFRQGKVPMDYVRKLFHQDLLEESMEELVNEKTKELLGDVKNLATYPNVSKEYKEGEGMTIKIEYELLPEVVMDGIETYEVEGVSAEVKEEEILHELEHLRYEVAEVAPVENGVVVDNEELTVDFEFQIVNPQTGKWMKKEVLSDRVIKQQTFMNVKEQLLGMKVGEEKVFRGRIPESIESHSFSGKETDARVKILAARKTTLPELNDEFAKSLGEYTTLEELKGKMQETLKARKEAEKPYELGERVLDVMEERCDFGVPLSFLFQEMNQYYRRGLQLSTADSWKLARKNVKKMFLVEKIAEREKIHAQEAEIEDYIAQEAHRYNVPAEMLKSYLKEEQINSIEHSVARRKVLKFLGESAKTKETSQG